MRITRSKARNISEITIDENIAMETYKLTGLGAPAAQNDSLRYGQTEIRNAEIAAAAEIVYSKLKLDLGIIDADVNAGAAIALSKLASAVYTETEVNTLFTNHVAVGDAHHTAYTNRLVELLLEDAGRIEAVLATVADFQTNPATGTVTNPENINDNNTASVSTADAVNEYQEIDYGKVVIIKRWRQWGHVSNDGDGRFTIQYWDLDLEAWTDWSTDIATRVTADWSEFVTETVRFTTKVKIIHTAIDTGPVPDYSYIHEMEIID